MNLWDQRLSEKSLNQASLSYHDSTSLTLLKTDRLLEQSIQKVLSQLSARWNIRSINEIKSIDADILTVSNPGCFIQLQGGGRMLKLNLEVMYITDLLYNSYLKGE